MNGFWDKAFPAAVGSLIGGLITISTLLVKEFFDRRRSVQAWFEQTYISEGIERLLVYLSTLDDLLSQIDHGTSIGILTQLVGPYPLEAVERFRILFPGLPASMLSLSRLECELVKAGSVPDLQGAKSMSQIVKITREECTLLQEALLEVQISKKAQVHQIRNRKRVLPICERLEARVMKAVTGYLGPQGRQELVDALKEQFASECSNDTDP
jgi:hypothetical protein